MPIYEYECSQCHRISDTLQKVSDPAPEKCPHCGAEHSLSRKLSKTSFILKGGGWYADLYASSKDKEKKPESKAEGAEGKTDGKSESSAATVPAAGATPSSGAASTSSDSGTSGSSTSSGSTGGTPKVAASGEKG
jgi:putative FmdB family regulatory protein